MNNFEVIVIGGGHAGTEASLAAARAGARTLLLTHNFETLGQMSCNPAIGGIGKGHLVKELDAMGGAMALAADQAGIHFRILNASKGPAVQATRAQADRNLYRNAIRKILENQPNLTLFQQEVADLILDGTRVIGVKTQLGLKFYAPSVVLTAGTFLRGKIHVGPEQYSAGRAGDPPSIALADRLRELPFRIERLKTGTPPRIDGKTINFASLIEQPGDHPLPVFSFMGTAAMHPRQVSCYITHTTAETHEIIRASLANSPLFNGQIAGIGPRYCPSIEDKVVRFAEREQHQIFIEPEGLDLTEIYPNGISTSLPFATQIAVVKSIPGFENAHITRPGYAIEYDFFNPQDLRPSLETKALSGLFFAGQINGTTGYEEAAAQGLVAGLNAARAAQQLEPWTPARAEAYMGVLIDDLITKGTQEPYRMFTSRAEYRLLLREDNADLRLTEIAHNLGLIDEERWAAFNRKQDGIAGLKQKLKDTWVQPQHALAEKLKAKIAQPLSREYSAHELLKRPELTCGDLLENLTELEPDLEVIRQVEIQIKYAGYIDRQMQEIARLDRYQQEKIPADFEFAHIPGLSKEIIEKLTRLRPPTVGHASRISGVTPAAISLILIYLKKQNVSLSN